jgi:predicted nucleic acid-binding Zn ribbon protein
MRRRKRNLVHLGDVLSAVGNRRLKKLHKYELWNRWEELVGSTVAAHARPSSWRRNTLVVTVENHAWMQELLFLREELLGNIRRGISKTRIDDIRFEIGRIEKQASSPERSESSVSLPQLTPDEKGFARDTARPVADDETRKTIRRLIEKDLQLKRQRS